MLLLEGACCETKEGRKGAQFADLSAKVPSNFETILSIVHVV